MSEIEHHMIRGAPPPVAPYSHAVESDGWVYVTGQLPMDPHHPEAPLPEGILAQTYQVLENLKTVLEGVGLGLDRVVFVRIYLTDLDGDYGRVNQVYADYFPEGARPGRTCVGVTRLALGARVEMDLVAKRG